MIKHFITSSLAIAVTSTALLIAPSASRADSFCQCVGYVKNVYGITKPMGNAKDMVNSLPKNGFQKVSNPRSGDVVVMGSSFPGADSTYGHVGFVDTIQEGRVVVRGANQGRRNLRSDAGCSNVSSIKFGTPIAGRNDISFWRR